MNIEAMAAEARGRLHLRIDRAGLRAADEFRAVVAAHRAALSGRSFTRSLGQRLRRARDRQRRAATDGLGLG